jgi:hypothetical protein
MPPQLTPASLPPQLAPAAVPQPLVSLTAAQQTAGAGSADAASHVAPTDDDLDDESVDEEWVNKAKSVVEQMHADPFTEAQALNKLKAEYLQRRFGKKIKIDS